MNWALGTNDEDEIPFSSIDSDYQNKELPDLIQAVRTKLDSGLGDRFFDKYRATEGEEEGEYQLIIAGALLMRVGARIRDADLQHLRELVPKVVCNEGFCMPLYDEGFRGPGKRQFLAALDNYQAGIPRDYHEPRYFLPLH